MRRPRSLALNILVLLALQLLLSTWTNLFVTAPPSHPGSNADEYFTGVVQGVAWALTQSGLPALVMHAALGLFLLLASLYAIVIAFRGSARTWKIVMPIGALGIIAAGFNGASFINYGHDVSSLLKTIGFLVALLAYVVGHYVSGAGN